MVQGPCLFAGIGVFPPNVTIKGQCYHFVLSKDVLAKQLSVSLSFDQNNQYLTFFSLSKLFGFLHNISVRCNI